MLAIAMLLLLMGILIGRYDWLPISRVAALVRAAKESIQKEITVRKNGEEKYVNAVLSDIYKKRTSNEEPARTLDTSRLPLILDAFPLPKDGVFASDRGGAVTIIEGTLVVMDSVGNISTFQDDSLHKIDLGAFPNNLNQFIAKSRFGRHILRTHYLAYDNALSTLYASFERFDVDSKEIRICIAAITIDHRTLKKTGDWKIIFESKDVSKRYDKIASGIVSGGRLAISGNSLFFSVGDYNDGKVPKNESEAVSQNPKSSLGKIYEYDISKKKFNLKSVGFRNVQGLVITKDGRLISSEQGPAGGDELNIVLDGENYGWPYRTDGTDYGTFNWPIKIKEPNVKFTEPLHSWVPSVAISPLIQISDFDPSWENNLLAGSLKTKSLYRMKLLGDRIVFTEQIWIGQRIRDIVQWNDKIVLMTDYPSLIFVSINKVRLKGNRKSETIVEMSPKLAICMKCHHFGATNPSHIAPTLANIVGKRIASDDFSRYSNSIKKNTGNWDENSLAKFIIDPNDFSLGTSMPRLNLSREEVLEIVKQLKN